MLLDNLPATMLSSYSQLRGANMTMLELRDWLNNLKPEFLETTQALVKVNGNYYNIENWRIITEAVHPNDPGTAEILWPVSNL